MLVQDIIQQIYGQKPKLVMSPLRNPIFSTIKQTFVKKPSQLPFKTSMTYVYNFMLKTPWYHLQTWPTKKLCTKTFGEWTLMPFALNGNLQFFNVDWWIERLWSELDEAIIISFFFLSKIYSHEQIQVYRLMKQNLFFIATFGSVLHMVASFWDIPQHERLLLEL